MPMRVLELLCVKKVNGIVINKNQGATNNI